MNQSALVVEPVLVPPGGGEVVGDSPDRRVEILSDHEQLHATWSRFGPRREGADLHVHRRHTDLLHPPPPDGGRPPTDAVVGGDGFVADRPGLRVALLADVEEIGISETRSDPGGPSAPLHLHRRHVESFYVLEGEMTFTASGRELRAGPGSWAQVPPGAPHTFALTGSRPVRFLNLHTPSCGFGAFLRGLHEARGEDELAAVRAAFDQVPA